MAKPTPAVRTPDGARTAPFIHGCWQLASDHGTPPRDEAELFARWREAVEIGFTTFDCADIYTGVERLLGRFLATLQDPSVVQVHTKYVPDRSALAGLEPAGVRRAIDRSLRRLGRESLDLVQFHWWDYAVPGWVETALELEALRRAGKVRRVGVTNFDLERVRELTAAGIRVSSAQVQYSVLDRRPASDFAPWCVENGISLLTYGALGGGLVTDRWLGRDEPVDSENRSQTKYRLVVDELGGWRSLQRILAALARVARRRSTTVAAAALRWALERPGTTAVIVGTGRRNSLDDLVSARTGGWEADDWTALERLLDEIGGPEGPVYGLERESGGIHASILRTELQGGGSQ